MFPVELTELYLKECFISGKYRVGSPLPNQRVLADNIGVDRCTLRVALIALHSENWVLMRHGKPTVVRSFDDEGTLVTAASRVAIKDDDLSRKVYQEALQARNDLQFLKEKDGLIMNLFFNDLDRIIHAYEERQEDNIT